MDSSQTVSTEANQLKNFEFTGKAGEYFAIWIVNVCLTIITLGIYSAWAKVRTNQYFYGNTSLDGASFRYLADPRQILKGRIIALALFMLYYFSGVFSPVIAGITLLVIMLLVPALIVLSMAFRLRNSSYRNVKFNFNKNFRRAYLIFALPVLLIGTYVFVINLLQPGANGMQEVDREFLILVSLLPIFISLMFPWWEYMITKFKITNSRYGDSELDYHARTTDYYLMYIKAAFVPMLIMIAVGIAVALVAAILEPLLGSFRESQAAAVMLPVAMVLVILPAYLWMFAYIQTRRTNLIYNNITIKGHQLKSDLKVGYMAFLYITNTLAIVLSLGLLMPWAKIRTAHYRAQMTALLVDGDLGTFLNQQQQAQSAYGEEIGEMFDLDVGF